MRPLALRVLLLVFVLAAAEMPLHAYLDPGSSSLLIQALLGGIAAVMLVMKTYWRRITSVFQRSSPERGHGPDEPPR